MPFKKLGNVCVLPFLSQKHLELRIGLFAALENQTIWSQSLPQKRKLVISQNYKYINMLDLCLRHWYKLWIKLKSAGLTFLRKLENSWSIRKPMLAITIKICDYFWWLSVKTETNKKRINTHLIQLFTYSVAIYQAPTIWQVPQSFWKD